jgi:predicted HD superfamily hydrolase involved in NAD metabolism
MSDGLSTESPHERRHPALHAGDGPCRFDWLRPYCERVRAMIGPDRFGHVARVVELAESIARANGFSDDEYRATCLAALLHDVARDLPDERLLELAPPEHELERAHPMALHGRAGCAIARSWGVADERVLGAIEGHVFGVDYGDRVGMALYVADVSEPGRGVNVDVRELALHDLARAYRRAVVAKVRYLRRCGKAIHPHTLKVHDEIALAH